MKTDLHDYYWLHNISIINRLKDDFCVRIIKHVQPNMPYEYLLAKSISMDDALLSKVMRALECSWSAKTSYCFSPDAAPSYGQCAQTAIVIWELFGGEILKTGGWPPNGLHFYNRIHGFRYDFTAEQFSMPDYSHDVKYDDTLSSVAEAESEAEIGQIDELRRAFREAFKVI